MARTTPSRAKSKTPAPKKALTPIEKRIISLEVRLSAGAKVRGLQDARITKLELYGTANVDSWIEQHDNRIKAIEGRLDKLASPTVAVEEKWVPKVGEWVVCLKLQNQISGIEVGEAYKVQEGGVEGKVCVIDADGDPRWWEPEHFRPATPEEIAAHEAKAEAQAAEDAKLVFGARVEVKGRENEIWKIGCDEPTDEGYWRLCPSKCGNLNTMTAKRHEFTLLP